MFPTNFYTIILLPIKSFGMIKTAVRNQFCHIVKWRRQRRCKRPPSLFLPVTSSVSSSSPAASSKASPSVVDPCSGKEQSSTTLSSTMTFRHYTVLLPFGQGPQHEVFKQQFFSKRESTPHGSLWNTHRNISQFSGQVNNMFAEFKSKLKIVYILYGKNTYKKIKI